MLPKNVEDRIYSLVETKNIQIDEDGCIWRLDRTVKQRAEHNSGAYFQVRAMLKGKRYEALAHRLVWRHFNGPIPAKITINHINGEKKDNRPSNLELATYSEQCLHAVRILGKRCQDGEKNHRAKLTCEMVRQIRNRRALGESLKQIAGDYNIAFQTVSKVARRARWASIG